MSLASFLLGGGNNQADKAASKAAPQKTKHVDQDLDALFRSNPAPPVVPAPTKGKPISIPSNTTLPSPVRGQKRKRQQGGLQAEPAEPHAQPTAPTPKAAEESPKAQKRKKAAKVSAKHDASSEDEEGDDARLEDGYLTRRTSQNARVDEEPSSAHEPSSEDDEDAEPPVHETHTGVAVPKARTKARKKTKYIPPNETSAQRDARTIFVGNIPVDVAKSKSSQKQFKRHFMSRVPGSKIESIRFRSVAFATATSALPAEDGKPTPTKKPDNPSTKQQRQQERAAQWRESDNAPGKGKRTHGEDSETSDREDSSRGVRKPTALNPAEKKRVAFIKGDFHKEVDTVNAYVVFAHEPPGTAEVETPVHPFEAARLAVERCDGTSFLDRTIRVDRVGKWREGSGVEGPSMADAKGDPRKTLFVGNLDFAAKEEELRVWFEGVVSQERGPPGAGVGGESDSGDDEGADKPKTWVKSVRVVRDRETQLGKGFAYVRFADRDCVDEVLALEQDKLKFAKRKLRVQRCKVVPGGRPIASSGPQAKSTTTGKPPASKPVHAKKAVPPTPMPQGDPALGAKLVGLSKEDRKAAKAGNVDRVQRRLAKKKVKAELDKAKVKEKMGGGGKTRDRERKKSGKGEKPGGKVNKGRIRSEKSAVKRNMKK